MSVATTQVGPKLAHLASNMNLAMSLVSTQKQRISEQAGVIHALSEQLKEGTKSLSEANREIEILAGKVESAEKSLARMEYTAAGVGGAALGVIVGAIAGLAGAPLAIAGAVGGVVLLGGTAIVKNCT